MVSNLDRYRQDLDRLISDGDKLIVSMALQFLPKDTALKALGLKEPLKGLPNFIGCYQAWYSEAKALVRQLLPDRLEDFVRHYEKPKSRKNLNNENYRIDDCLQGLHRERSLYGTADDSISQSAAIPHFQQQVAIVKSVKARFDSSLFDIRQLVQADLFDSELSAAAGLAENGFTRPAGALAGVVLEKHLAQVCENHQVKITKKNPTISDFNDALKAADVIETSVWRFVQHLGDIRNKCDHGKTSEPTKDEVTDLIEGVVKITKTVF